MDERNRRDRNRRDNDGYGRNQDYYSSRQAEQFEDSSAYSQDDSWSASQQGSERSRPVGMYYEEYVVRGPRRDRSSDRLREGNDRMAPDSYMSRESRPDRGRSDGGYGYFTSESQGGRDFTGYSQRDSYSSGAAPRSAYGYDREASGYSTPRYSDTPRGRDWWDRTTDEVASWFGDEDAARRRKMDHRGRGPSDYTRSDDRIREDVNDNLTQDWAVDARKVSVKVENGEVTLDGTVPTRLQKRRAEDCAEDVSGVSHVQNNLRVQDNSDWSQSNDETRRSTARTAD